MKRSKLGIIFGIGSVFLAASAGPASADVALTGLIEFSTDATGASSGGSIWNTRGGDSFFNLYVTGANSGIGGGFVNDGDAAGAGINLALSPGTSQFFIFGEPGADIGHFALNLFFNGNNSAPGISTFAATNTSTSPPPPSFSADGSPSTLALDASTAAGAGTLSFTSGGTTVALTAYEWSAPAVETLDRVSAFNNVPSGVDDFVGSFTLQVSTVPEPTSVVMLAGGAVVFLGYGRRRRADRD